jgi:hypothetical protein
MKNHKFVGISLKLHALPQDLTRILLHLLGRRGFQQFDISVVLNNRSGVPNVCYKVV